MKVLPVIKTLHRYVICFYGGYEMLGKDEPFFSHIVFQEQIEDAEKIGVNVLENIHNDIPKWFPTVYHCIDGNKVITKFKLVNNEWVDIKTPLMIQVKCIDDEKQEDKP